MRRRFRLFAENEIAPSSECCWDAAFAELNDADLKKAFVTSLLTDTTKIDTRLAAGESTTSLEVTKLDDPAVKALSGSGEKFLETFKQAEGK